MSEGVRLLDRELSQLDYLGRIIAIAEDDAQPLLERAKFCGIVSDHLDEFFQVRVGGLKTDEDADPQRLDTIRGRARATSERLTRVFREQIEPALQKAGVAVCAWDRLPPEEREALTRRFDDEIAPTLTPLGVDDVRPFPFISNLSLNLAAVLRSPGAEDTKFARIKVPPLFPRLLPSSTAPDDLRFVPVEDVIGAHLDRLFPGLEIVGWHQFRVTRSASESPDTGDGGGLVEAMQDALAQRQRFTSVVRLEVDDAMPSEVCDLVVTALGVEDSEIVRVSGLLDLTALGELHGVDRPDLKEPPWTPVTQSRLADAARDVFSVIRDRDVLIHFPYESFDTSLGAFIEQAADDPDVLAIKESLYRTSGPDSPAIRALTRAARTGKQAVALVELKARFDEEANITWAGMLEEAGVHVLYGVEGLKAHPKVALVVRREEGQIRRYVYIGTGNLNPASAKVYEDVGLFTCEPELGADVSDLFNFLSGYSECDTYRELLVAPVNLRQRVLDLIAEEAAHDDARIVIKVNNLVDEEVIEALYAASRAGAEIDLIVRSICSLRPGVEGLSERIRVRSIVGRYLEHSRIFCFGSVARGRRYYIGSADLMPRNLDRRVEAVTPVRDSLLRDRLQQILELNLADDQLAWVMTPDGGWERAAAGEAVNLHDRLEEVALPPVPGD